MYNNTPYDIEKYELDFEEQNKILLSEMKRYDKNSEMYKLRLIQYETNLLHMKINKELGFVLCCQVIN